MGAWEKVRANDGAPGVDAVGWLAGHDMLGELRQRADRGNYPALRALVWRLAHRDMGDELRELAQAADAGRRLLILDWVKEAGGARCLL